MRLIPYTKQLGSIELSSLTYQVVKALCESNSTLATNLILSQHDLDPKEAAAAVRTIRNMPDYPWNYIVDWSVQAELEITDAEHALINSMYRAEHPLKVTAIKFLRNQYELGLKEAKDICDYIGAQSC